MNFTAFGHTPSSVVYTVVPSKRGDSREAVVLVIATRWTLAGGKANPEASYGLGIGVALGQYLRTVPWLSKDVLLVFVDSSLPYGAGARAWLRAYFGGYSSVRRGVLRQAVILEPGNRPSSLLCNVEGINGAVPNQDVVNSYMVQADKAKLQVAHREAWESVASHFWNGGVHSSHAPFLELQVPAFTVQGQRGRVKTRELKPHEVAQTLEGVVRCLSNNLQQLHHSFNFYFFTGRARHISNGLYLYPVFAMMFPLISFLMTTPTYRDIRSMLVSLGAIALVIVASGSPVFLLGTDAKLVAWLRGLAAATDASPLALPPTCEHPRPGAGEELMRRQAAALWLSTGGCAAAAAALLLRQYAFTVFDATGKADTQGGGVRLPGPLWESMRAASGFAYLLVLAPFAIYSWAVAMPLTIVCVPMLVFMRPISFRGRPLSSCFLVVTVAVNVFFLAAPPRARAEWLGEAGLGGYLLGALDAFDKSVVPLVPQEGRAYLPTPLVRWLRGLVSSRALQADLLLQLHELARDFNCVGGMLFPVFCFAYWPLLVLLVLIGAVLPAQRVDDGGLSLRQVRLFALVVLSLVALGVVGGVYWRSHSSSGLGRLQW
ncbi:unnamed protein product [Prorocentrum cordatum]|uniref:GPI ethanolamine phosphate transferase 1 n=1 Tax=Prorocentrum cordatum TaxID=2364126 RepID=A0ABN9S5R2_9DINO|nr:unnamed protein product [Polarella glacialis]